LLGPNEEPDVVTPGVGDVSGDSAAAAAGADWVPGPVMP